MILICQIAARRFPHPLFDVYKPKPNQSSILSFLFLLEKTRFFLAKESKLHPPRTRSLVSQEAKKPRNEAAHPPPVSMNSCSILELRQSSSLKSVTLTTSSDHPSCPLRALPAANLVPENQANTWTITSTNPAVTTSNLTLDVLKILLQSGWSIVSSCKGGGRQADAAGVECCNFYMCKKAEGTNGDAANHSANSSSTTKNIAAEEEDNDDDDDDDDNDDDDDDDIEIMPSLPAPGRRRSTIRLGSIADLPTQDEIKGIIDSEIGDTGNNGDEDEAITWGK